MITKNMTRKAYRRAYWLDLGALVAACLVLGVLFMRELMNFL